MTPSPHPAQALLAASVTEIVWDRPPLSFPMDGSVSSTSAVFFFQAEDGIRDHCVTGVQTCALPIYLLDGHRGGWSRTFLAQGRDDPDKVLTDGNGARAAGAYLHLRKNGRCLGQGGGCCAKACCAGHLRKCRAVMQPAGSAADRPRSPARPAHGGTPRAAGPRDRRHR